MRKNLRLQKELNKVKRENEFYFFDKTVCKIYYTSATSVVFHKIILLSIIIGYELSEILRIRATKLIYVLIVITDSYCTSTFACSIRQAKEIANIITLHSNKKVTKNSFKRSMEFV